MQSNWLYYYVSFWLKHHEPAESMKPHATCIQLAAPQVATRSFTSSANMCITWTLWPRRGSWMPCNGNMISNVNRLQQELVVELLESTTGDELRMMLARQLPIWDVFHMARSSHSLQSRGAATQNDWPPIELFLVGSLAFSNFWCSQVRMKDILDEGGDFYNLHKLVFHDLDPEMCFGCKRHGQNMCFLFRSCPAPFMMFPYMCSFFPNS